MTASSIAQYLEQRRASRPGERDVARKDPWAALTNRAAAAADPEDRETAAFRPLTFRSAEVASSRPASNFGDSGASESIAPRPSSALFRPREVPPPQPDIEERLAEAYHRGVQEGLDAARGEAATARALERAELQKRAVVERLDFQMNEYAKLGEAISQSFAEIERRIADSVARILRPFLLVSITSRAVEDLTANLAKLSSSGHPPLLKISGPEPLLKVLKSRVADLAIEIEFTPNAQVEVKVEASHTTIATELGPWIELIQSLSEDADR
jgi:hypothetical protein